VVISGGNILSPPSYCIFIIRLIGFTQNSRSRSGIWLPLSPMETLMREVLYEAKVLAVVYAAVCRTAVKCGRWRQEMKWRRWDVRCETDGSAVLRETEIAAGNGECKNGSVIGWDCVCSKHWTRLTLNHKLSPNIWKTSQ